MSDQYHLTTTAPSLAPRRPSVTIQRYSPWQLGGTLIFAVLMHIALALGGHFLVLWLGYGNWGWTVTLLAAPLSGVLLVWVWKALRVELRRLDEEGHLFGAPAPVDLVPSPEPASAAAPKHLRLGLVMNGRIVAPADGTDPALMRLKAKCLKLVVEGRKRGNWSRSSLAEGDGAIMPGADWDEASAELQRLDLFHVTKGRGGGLKPVRPDDLARDIERLEVAR